METIMITPRTERQMATLKELLEGLRWDMGIRYVPEGKVSEEDMFWPDLERQLAKDRDDFANGRLTTLPDGTFEEFYDSIGRHGI